MGLSRRLGRRQHVGIPEDPLGLGSLTGIAPVCLLLINAAYFADEKMRAQSCLRV